MSSVSEQIKFIKNKVATLISENQQLKSTANELNQKIEDLMSQQLVYINRITSLEKSMALLSAENEKLQTVGEKPVETAPNSGLSSKEIDKMIKEIDECLALLDI